VRAAEDLAAPFDPPVAAAPAAHRRPGLVAVLYGYRALAGLLIALPAAAALGGATAQYPRAQAELWDAGGLMLLESLRLSRRAQPVVFASASSLSLLAIVFGLFPLAALIAGLGRSGRLSVGFLAARAWAHAGTVALAYGLGALAQVLLAIVLWLVGAKVITATRIAPPAEDVATAALVVVIFAALAAVGVVRDLAYVGAVHGGHRFYMATSRALRCVVRRPGGALLGWSWRSALGASGLVLAAWAAPSLRGVTTAGVLAGVLLHQASLFGVAYARASWLAAGIRLLDATAPARSEPTEGTAPARSEPTEGTAPAAPAEATAPASDPAPPEPIEPGGAEPAPAAPPDPVAAS
jgi:hypothetical protein